MPPPPILIAGPTASGKSALAMAIAKRTPATIINADALQVYSLWRVLTARPSLEDEAAYPHRLYGHVPPDEPYSVGLWLGDLAPLLDAEKAQARRPIIIGGTGLYFSALTDGLADIPPIPAEVRARGNALRTRPDGFAALETRDPVTWARIDRNNPARLQRAWEVLEATGRPLSEWQADASPPLLPLEKTVPICITSDKAWLNARIEKRFDLMLSGGALDECSEWIQQGVSPELPAAKALGAPELIAYLAGTLPLDEARTRAVTATRQFAKRQRSWFRSRMGDWHKIDLAATSPQEAAQHCLALTQIAPRR